MADFRLVEEAKRPLAMNPKKFALWLLMVSIGMLFAAWTSAYIVRRGDGDWQLFQLPALMWVNSAVIIASSGTMIWAVRMARKDELVKLRLALVVTAILGVAFLVGQVVAWGTLLTEKVYFVGGNPAAGFVYILTAVHGAHIISGVIFLLVVLVASLRFRVHSKNMQQLELCASYWHFLDGLWIYLFIFLLLYR